MNEQRWTSSELSEFLNSADVDLPALQDAGLVSADALDLLISIKNNHPQGDESEIFEKILEKETSHQVRDAVEEGNISTMAFATGVTHSDDSLDIGKWQDTEALKDFFRKPQVTDLTNNVFQAVIYSSAIPPTGRGKTSTAYTLIEIADVVHDDLTILSNNPSDEFSNTPAQWTNLKETIRKEDGWTIVLIDEAAQFLQYSDQTAGKQVSQMLKLLRHNQCHLILVGHTGRDVPADIRRQMFFVNKKSEKSAVIGHGLTPKSSGDRMEVETELFELDNIPHTDIEYKSQGEETINIQFDSDDSDDNDGRTLCKGTNRHDERCGQLTSHESGFCANHRHQSSSSDSNSDSNAHA